MSSHSRGGFTLIELVVAVVVLGILAALVIPRFTHLERDARVSAVNGMAASLRSSAALVHRMALERKVVHDNPSTGLILLGGRAIDVVEGYPAASLGGIVAALPGLDPAVYAVTPGAPRSGSITIEVVGAVDHAHCRVTYTQPAAPGAAGVVGTPLTSGC